MALHWERQTGWDRTNPTDLEGPPFEGPATKYFVFRKADDVYDLWVWSGPHETVFGGMGADYRGMKRAKQLGEFPTLKQARAVAEVYHSTNEAGPTPFEVLDPLATGRSHRFADWPNDEIEPSPAGIYTVWDGDDFIYVGMAGKKMGVDPSKIPGGDEPAASPKNPLRARLNAHASGRRSGDQFCVYVCDRFVVPMLDGEKLVQVGEGKLKLDALTKSFVREHFEYRYITDLGNYPALQLERQVQRGALEAAGKPFLNPL